MLPTVNKNQVDKWLSKLTGYQRKIVKGRLMFELRLSWTSLHKKLKQDSWTDTEKSKIRSIFSDYLQITKEAA